ncbi:hypothetical protein [Rickettsia endosymbiont of Rhinocyllus conicus]|uniref:hypothetical protein n=1 Tax=Rickettsia endosymbiont of Rhinocyllus conicus TaxID=3066252 RepID=UPI00313352C2
MQTEKSFTNKTRKRKGNFTGNEELSKKPRKDIDNKTHTPVNNSNQSENYNDVFEDKNILNVNNNSDTSSDDCEIVSVSLNNNGQLLPNKYRKIDVPGDDSCLFWAVALAYLTPVKDDHNVFKTRFRKLFGHQNQLSTIQKCIQKYDHNIPNNDIFKNLMSSLVTQDFRKMVCDYISDNKKRFNFQDPLFNKSSNDELNYKELESHIQQMRKTTTWGTCLEQEAMALMLACNIHTYSHAQTPQVYPIVNKNTYGDKLILHFVNAETKNYDTKSANHFMFSLLNNSYVLEHINDNSDDAVSSVIEVDLESSNSEIKSQLGNDNESKASNIVPLLFPEPTNECDVFDIHNHSIFKYYSKLAINAKVSNLSSLGTTSRPYYSKDYITLIKHYLKLGFLDSAFELYSVLGKYYTDFNSEDIELSIGKMYARIGKYSKARECYSKITNSDLIDKARILIGNSFFQEGKYDAAIEYYKQVSELCGISQSMLDLKRYCQSRLNIGNSYLKKANYKAARYYYDIVSDMLEEDYYYNMYNKAQIGIAYTWLKEGQNDRSETHYNKIKQIDCDDTNKVFVGNILIKNKEYAQAKKWLEQINKYSPYYSQSQICIGNICCHEGKYSEAREHYNKVREERKGAYYYSMAQINIGHSFRKEAKKHYNNIDENSYFYELTSGYESSEVLDIGRSDYESYCIFRSYKKEIKNKLLCDQVVEFIKRDKSNDIGGMSDSSDKIYDNYASLHYAENNGQKEVELFNDQAIVAEKSKRRILKFKEELAVNKTTYLTESSEKIENNLKQDINSVTINGNSNTTSNIDKSHTISSIQNDYKLSSDNLTQQECKLQPSTKFNVPDDGHCLFWAVALAYLIPSIKNENEFINKFKKLFGENNSDNIKLKEQLIRNARTLDYSSLKQNAKISKLIKCWVKCVTKEYDHNDAVKVLLSPEKAKNTQKIQEYATQIQDGKIWGGSAEIKAMSSILDINIVVYRNDNNSPELYSTEKDIRSDDKIVLHYINSITKEYCDANHYMFSINDNISLHDELSTDQENHLDQIISEDYIQSSEDIISNIDSELESDYDPSPDDLDSNSDKRSQVQTRSYIQNSTQQDQEKDINIIETYRRDRFNISVEVAHDGSKNTLDDYKITDIVIKRHSQYNNNHTVPLSFFSYSLSYLLVDTSIPNAISDIDQKYINQDRYDNNVFDKYWYRLLKQYNDHKSEWEKCNSNRICKDSIQVFFQEKIVPYIVYRWNTRIMSVFKEKRLPSEYGKEGSKIKKFIKKIFSESKKEPENILNDDDNLTEIENNIQNLLKEFLQCIDLPKDSTEGIAIILSDARELFSILLFIIERSSSNGNIYNNEGIFTNEYEQLRNTILDKKNFEQKFRIIVDKYNYSSEKLQHELKIFLMPKSLSIITKFTDTTPSSDPELFSPNTQISSNVAEEPKNIDYIAKAEDNQNDNLNEIQYSYYDNINLKYLLLEEEVFHITHVTIDTDKKLGSQLNHIFNDWKLQNQVISYVLIGRGTNFIISTAMIVVFKKQELTIISILNRQFALTVENYLLNKFINIKRKTMMFDSELNNNVDVIIVTKYIKELRQKFLEDNICKEVSKIRVNYDNNKSHNIYDLYKNDKKKIDSAYYISIEKLQKVTNLKNFEQIINGIKTDQYRTFESYFHMEQLQYKKIKIIRFIIQSNNMALIESVSKIKINDDLIYKWYINNDENFIDTLTKCQSLKKSNILTEQILDPCLNKINKFREYINKEQDRILTRSKANSTEINIQLWLLNEISKHENIQYIKQALDTNDKVSLLQYCIIKCNNMFSIIDTIILKLHKLDIKYIQLLLDITVKENDTEIPLLQFWFNNRKDNLVQLDFMYTMLPLIPELGNQSITKLLDMTVKENDTEIPLLQFWYNISNMLTRGLNFNNNWEFFFPEQINKKTLDKMQTYYESNDRLLDVIKYCLLQDSLFKKYKDQFLNLKIFMGPPMGEDIIKNFDYIIKDLQIYVLHSNTIFKKKSKNNFLFRTKKV